MFFVAISALFPRFRPPRRAAAEYTEDMKTSMRFLLTALALGLASCVQEGEEPKTVAPPPVVLPADPGNAGKTNVVGVDSDADGVRDDVQIHIHGAYTDPVSRKAATQLAKAFQDLLVGGSTASGALTATASLNAAIDCLYGLDPASFGERVEDVEGAVVNTGKRARAYARAGAFISGGSYAVSTVADNVGACEEAP